MTEMDTQTHTHTHTFSLTHKLGGVDADFLPVSRTPNVLCARLFPKGGVVYFVGVGWD